MTNDIAIIRLSRNANLNDYVQPVCLWPSSKLNITKVVNRDGTVIGWGHPEMVETSNELREVSMPVVPFATCLDSYRSYFGHYITDTNFCAGIRNGWLHEKRQ